jgi:diguanylate cyclase (GGDEF)-like protein/PAS domain S-box-containing protein
LASPAQARSILAFLIRGFSLVSDAPQQRRFIFRRGSLATELLAWWCAASAILLATFLWAGHRRLEHTLVTRGGERASVAAEQLAQMVGRASAARKEQIAAVAGEDAIRRYLKDPTPSNLQAAQESAGSLATPLPHSVALWDVEGRRLFQVAPPLDSAPVTIPLPDGVAPTQARSIDLHATSTGVVYSETVAAVADAVEGEDPGAAGTLLGYLVVRAAVANPRRAAGNNSADPITQLLGAKATIAIGNPKGAVWTDLSRQVPAPPVVLTHEGATDFHRPGGSRHVGALVHVPATPWVVWVEFPAQALLAPAGVLLRQGLWFGLASLVICAGIIATVIARRIRPLTELAQAAEHIAAGDYGRRVRNGARNEIGQLADSFNVMATHVEDAYRSLQHAKDRTEFALGAFRLGVWEVDLASSRVEWSAAIGAVYGLPTETVPRNFDSVLACIHADDRPRVVEAVATRQDYSLEFRVVWPDQSIHWVNSRAHFQQTEAQPAPRLLGVSMDITERKALEDALFAEHERAEVTLHSIGDAVLSTDVAGRVTYVNAAAERLTGWTSAEGLGRPLLEVLHIVDATTRIAAEDPASKAMRLEAAIDLGGNCLLIRKDGTHALVEDSAAPIHDRHGRVTGAVIVFRDVSAERALTLKMAHLARFDVLTGLPNRTLFQDRITQAIALARRKGTRIAALFVDLDRFKHVNDSLGHAVGDALLQSVTARLIACVRASDTVSRRGGDEFVVLLPDLEEADPAAIVADNIIAAISEPHELLQHVLHVTASIGISIYPDDALDPEVLIGAADTAMYHAKQSGRGNAQFFTPEMNARSVARRSLESSIRKALRRQEFVLHYQPKVSLTTSAIVGVEALVRWQHPTRGLVAPAEFVSLAEECGLILPLGRWVLLEACRQAKSWEDAGLGSREIAVNVSAVEFRAKGFLEHVTAVLDDTGLDPACLELEMTESVLMAQADETTRVLLGLKKLGVRLAIDDFGTGYSSLSYLSRFPIDTLKIDRSFVQGMTLGGHDATIINAIISMGRSLNQCVVAEGVETAEQLALLQGHRCGQGQGYYFSRPVPPERLADLLRTAPALTPGDRCPTAG